METRITQMHRERNRRSGLEVLRITSRSPCCKRRVCFFALLDVPRERYERTCRNCRAKWQIDRSIISENGRVRMDRLDWTCIRGAA